MARKTSKVDKQLGEHLKQAEDHLIQAVNLFTEDQKLSRRVGYFSRLVRVQEMATSVRQEELVWIRGPWRAGKAAGKRGSRGGSRGKRGSRR
jgi:hypothetical protein